MLSGTNHTILGHKSHLSRDPRARARWWRCTGQARKRQFKEARAPEGLTIPHSGTENAPILNIL